MANLAGFIQALVLNFVHQPDIGMPAAIIGAKRAGAALPLHHRHVRAASDASAHEPNIASVVVIRSKNPAQREKIVSYDTFSVQGVRLHDNLALAADQPGFRLGPGVGVTIRAAVLCFAGGLFLPLGFVGISPQFHAGKGKALADQRRASHVERAALLDVVAHLLPRLLAAWLSSVGGNQPKRTHLHGPFLVVVAGARRLAVVMLPEVGHLMHQGGEDFGGRPAAEVGGIQRNFIRGLAAIHGAKAPFGEGCGQK